MLSRPEASIARQAPILAASTCFTCFPLSYLLSRTPDQLQVERQRYEQELAWDAATPHPTQRKQQRSIAAAASHAP